jgi:two-component system chemotaxis response regulator CheB
MIKVLIVEDSSTVQELLVHILGADPEVRVVGTATNGEEALEAVKQERPDVITMDIHMPKMDGLEATRRIMETSPVPIVIVSGSSNPKEVATTFRAMEAGALAVVPRPRGIGHPDHESTAAELLQTVKLMSEVKVVRRWPQYRGRTSEVGVSLPAEVEHKIAPSEIRLVAIGASTGGPLVIQTILSDLPGSFPVPILLVQHMVADFIPGFAEWLNETVRLPVHVASEGADLLPGHVYVAPGGFQMRANQNMKIVLTRGESENGHCPSASHLFRSVTQVFGSRAVGVLLTGMGKDGAEELRFMKERGAVTIAQDKETSVVHGMPGEAIRLDAATYVLPAGKIASALIGLVNPKIRRNHE